MYPTGESRGGTARLCSEWEGQKAETRAAHRRDAESAEEDEDGNEESAGEERRGRAEALCQDREGSARAELTGAQAPRCFWELLSGGLPFRCQGKKATPPPTEVGGSHPKGHPDARIPMKRPHAGIFGLPLLPFGRRRARLSGHTRNSGPKVAARGSATRSEGRREDRRGWRGERARGTPQAPQR